MLCFCLSSFLIVAINNFRYFCDYFLVPRSLALRSKEFLATIALSEKYYFYLSYQILQAE